MSLKTDLNNATKRVFAVANSVLTSIQYHSAGTATYSTTTGGVTSPKTSHSVRVAFSSFKKEEVFVGIVSGSNQYPQLVQPHDKKVTIPIPNITLTPKLSDWITHDGETWDVINIQTDASNSVHILHLRRR